MNKSFAKKNAQKYTYTLQHFQQQKNMPLQKSQQENSMRQPSKIKTEQCISVRQSFGDCSQNGQTFFEFNKSKVSPRNRVISSLNFAKQSSCEYVQRQLFDRKIKQIQESIQCLNSKIANNSAGMEEFSTFLGKTIKQDILSEYRNVWIQLSQKSPYVAQMERSIQQIKSELHNIPNIIIQHQKIIGQIGQLQQQFRSRISRNQQQIVQLCQKTINQMSVDLLDRRQFCEIKKSNDFMVQNQQQKCSQQKIRSFYRSSSYKSGVGEKMKVTYNETMMVQKEDKVDKLQVSQSVYLIDCEGFILDDSSNYLINDEGYRIRLDQKHLSILRDNQLLKG